MTPNTVSVVLPAFNSAGLVTEAIDSVFAQSVPPTEVIVVDDGSTDDTADRLARYGDRIRYIRQPNGGVSSARNRGVNEASSDYVAFLDADDVWHPKKLERQLSALGADPGCVLLGTLKYEWPGDHPPSPISNSPIQYIPWKRLVVRNDLVTSSILVRRNALMTVGPFDTRLQGPEDHDLWIRLAETGSIGNLPVPLTGYRDVPASLSKHAKRMEQGMWRIVHKLTDRGGWSGRPIVRARARSMIHHQCAYMYAAAGEYPSALLRAVYSLVEYPLPYPRGLTYSSLERFKRLARVVLDWCHSGRG